MMFSRPIGVGLAVALLSMPAVTAFAQDAATPAPAPAVVDTDDNDDDGFDLGWLGLLGLAGLAGLRGRRHDATVHTRTTNTH